MTRVAESLAQLCANLSADLKLAEDAARAAAEGKADGGSCCLDAVFLNVGRDCSFTRKSKPLTTAVGYDSYIRSGWWRGYMLSVGTSCGQGARRTAAVEAATAFLKGKDWDVVTYYRVD